MINLYVKMQCQMNKMSNISKLIFLFPFCIKTVAVEWLKNYCGIALI